MATSAVNAKVIENPYPRLRQTSQSSFLLRAYASWRVSLFSTHLLDAGSGFHKVALTARIIGKPIDEADLYDFSLNFKEKCKKERIFEVPDRTSFTPQPTDEKVKAVQCIRPIPKRVLRLDTVC